MVAISRLRDMMEALNLSPAERALVEAAQTHVIGDANAARAIAAVYLAKKVEDAAGLVSASTGGLQIAMKQSTSKIIESNTTLADSNRRYALGLNILTAALVVVTLVQVLLPLFG